MAQVGGYTFAVWQGSNFVPPQYMVRELETDGENGVVYQGIGTRPVEIEVRTLVDVSTPSNAQSTLEGYVALVGTLVTCVDPNGLTHLNVLVKRVRGGWTKKFTVKDGGLNPSATCVLEAIWVLERQA